MRFKGFLIFLLLFFITNSDKILAQSNYNKLPSIRINDLQGKEIDISELSNEGKPFIIMCWATWCTPCLKELNNISFLYDDWKDEFGIKIFTINLDDSRSSSKVASFVEGKRWGFDVLLDTNQKLMQALNFSMPPLTVLLNGTGEIVWTHNSYMEGDEYLLEDKIRSLIENIKE